MQFLETLENKGIIPAFDIEAEIAAYDEMRDGYDPAKVKLPSYRALKSPKIRKAVGYIKEMYEQYNHSWAKEIRRRSADFTDRAALCYRGHEISYTEMFEKADLLAQALSNMGLGFGDEIPVCMNNVPELPIVMLAANMLGCKINSFNHIYASEYLETIISGCDHRVIFVTDDCYEELEQINAVRDIQRIVMVSLADSLPEHPEELDFYTPRFKRYFAYPNRVGEFKAKDSRIIGMSQALDMGREVKVPFEDVGDPDTEFLISYTSGSTKIGYPKAIVHCNRSLMIMGRFHDSEVCGNPEMKEYRTMVAIHGDSNTNLITGIGDGLSQGWTVVLEPEYDPYDALDYLIMNKPGYACLTSIFWREAARRVLEYPENRKIKLPFLFSPFVVGEAISKGEEYYINRFLKVTKAGSGVSIKGIHLPHVVISVGGGDCEHGGVYYTLFKGIYDKYMGPFMKRGEYGMLPAMFAQAGCFEELEDGTFKELPANELGVLAVNTPTALSYYKNNPEATRDMIAVDTQGREWIRSNVHGYIDTLGGIHLRGRIDKAFVAESGEQYPAFVIEDVVNRDYRNILCCIVAFSDDNIPVLNIQFQPDTRNRKSVIISRMRERCKARLPKELVEAMVYRIWETDTIPVTGSGKKSIRALEDMGTKGTESLIYSR